MPVEFAAKQAAVMTGLIFARRNNNHDLDKLSVTLTPRHLAATQYTIIALYSLATWHLLLFPVGQILDQLKFIFSFEYENRIFFIWFAIVSFLTLIVAATFWFKSADSYPIAPLLFFVSLGLLLWALWWADTVFIFSYSLGCIFSIWSWLRPNRLLKQNTL